MKKWSDSEHNKHVDVKRRIGTDEPIFRNGRRLDELEYGKVSLRPVFAWSRLGLEVI